MWIYSISKHTLYYAKTAKSKSRIWIIEGSAGFGPGLNNSKRCFEPDGPPPTGKYWVSDPYFDKFYGPDSVVLVPFPTTNLGNRAGTTFISHQPKLKIHDSGRNSLVLSAVARKWMANCVNRNLLIEV